MSDSEASDRAARINAALANIRIDAATAEVIGAFEQAAIECVLLKGPALSDWYEGMELRAYGDCDLWVGPDDVSRAEEVLANLGFARSVDDRTMPVWWREHATSWTRESDAVAIDLHRVLQAVAVSPGEAWRILATDTDEIEVAGRRARILAPAAKAVYVTLHAAHHGRSWRKPLTHLEAGLEATDETVWREAAELARRLDAVDAFATGLRLVPAGVALADRLALPRTESVNVALHASSPPPLALGFDQLASAPHHRARLEIIARKVVPPPTFIRHWWPPAERGPLLLMIGYLYRPLWLLGKAPRGARAWLVARRQVRHRP